MAEAGPPHSQDLDKCHRTPESQSGPVAMAEVSLTDRGPRWMASRSQPGASHLGHGRDPGHAEGAIMTNCVYRPQGGLACHTSIPSPCSLPWGMQWPRPTDLSLVLPQTTSAAFKIHSWIHWGVPFWGCNFSFVTPRKPMILTVG